MVKGGAGERKNISIGQISLYLLMVQTWHDLVSQYLLTEWFKRYILL